ncbi:hypothetical protein Q31b_18000 [Novipirellula aureliae]|uniref:Uncharacterized protein n=1 Tax=Novipirellula aureliae TaxID=2527966 RepID=A0A5C6E6P2_9BACT|nr:hypothetical protein Q31b_18000 [Novipirellula aureliae]
MVYFGPGVHDLTNRSVGDNKTIYIAGGAYIRGAMDADEKPVQIGLSDMLLPTFKLSGKNISIRGSPLCQHE